MKIIKMIKNFLSHDFVKHSKNYLIADFFNKALGFAAIPIFTRLLLPEEYGIIAIFMSIISIFTVLMSVNLHGALAIKYYEKENDFDEFVGSNILFILILNFFLITLFFIFREYIASFFSISSYLFFIAIVTSFFYIFIQSELTLTSNIFNKIIDYFFVFLLQSPIIKICFSRCFIY